MLTILCHLERQSQCHIQPVRHRYNVGFKHLLSNKCSASLFIWLIFAWWKSSKKLRNISYCQSVSKSVQNAAARLIYHMRSADHISDALLTLHWLRVHQRIEYKVAVMTYKVLHGTAPQYLGLHLHWSVIYLAGGHCALPTPVAFWCHLSDSQLSVAGLSPSLVPASGICYRRRLR